MDTSAKFPGFDREEAAKYEKAAAALDAFRANALRAGVRAKAAALLADAGWTPAAEKPADDAAAWAAAALSADDDAPEVPEETAAAIVEDLKSAA